MAGILSETRRPAVVEHAKKAIATLREFEELLAKGEALPYEVWAAFEAVHRRAEHLQTMLARKCKYCSKEVELGCNCCASCADERGP
jgi:hypothetical protein